MPEYQYGLKTPSAAGKALRQRVPRSTCGKWAPPSDRDPLGLIEAQEVGRLPELLPLRRERMGASPFTFYRGSAGVMAADLAMLPATGITVQACGDAHIANFGGYATPERNFIFDLNDFDETLPGPWEWDVLRMSTSTALAARDRGFSTATENAAVAAGIAEYRHAMAQFAQLTPLEMWYARFDVREVASSGSRTQTKFLQRKLTKAERRTAENLLPKLTAGEHPVFVDNPPTMRRLELGGPLAEIAREVIARYRDTLPTHVRVLLKRFEFEDVALKVVGVGSVGTRCLAVLALTKRGEPLLLQVKEAQPSVLEAYLPPSEFSNHGERVIHGQRLMQAASDIFLGWTSLDGRDYYVRQLRDMKVSADLTKITVAQLKYYSRYCGWTLARAHARSGDAQAIAEYLGDDDTFDRAAGAFSQTYADLAHADHARFIKAANAGAR